jgi:dTDP-4-amino-4,6-dideoxygalactose transaminase
MATGADRTLRIPFNRPFFTGKEFEFIQQALDNWHISGDGHFTRECHALIEQELGVSKALLTTSCTHALEMTALLLDLKPGDEIIVPSFTFVSTVNAFVLRGARPVFVDIRPDTLNLDEAKLEALVTSRTKAIVVIHYAGVACEMDAIMDIARRNQVPVIEDNAHGLLGKYKDRYLGTFGRLATLSFHETKNFTCGEGGALLINEPRYIERAEIIREKGTNRSRFFRGQVDKYSWVDVGSSYLPSDFLAAFLYAQLQAREMIQAKRRKIWEYYDEHLRDWAAESGVQVPFIPPHCEQPYHMYFLLLPSLEQRQSMMAHLNNHGINAVFHYLPLHLSMMGRRFGGNEGDCPVTEWVSDRLLRLPFFNDLKESDQSRIVHTIKDFTWERESVCQPPLPVSRALAKEIP